MSPVSRLLGFCLEHSGVVLVYRLVMLFTHCYERASPLLDYPRAIEPPTRIHYSSFRPTIQHWRSRPIYCGLHFSIVCTWAGPFSLSGKLPTRSERGARDLWRSAGSFQPNSGVGGRPSCQGCCGRHVYPVRGFPCDGCFSFVTRRRV